MKAVVIGTGYVAQAYLRALHFFGYHPLVLSRSWFDYYDDDKLRFCLKVYQPDVVINCAGYTGETVDDCEKNRKESWMANAILPNQISEITESLGIKLIHISSGCIFNGAGPYDEMDQPNFPDNAYQQHKWFSERWLIERCKNFWAFRIRMPFNHLPHPRNWLVKLCKYPRILDGLNSVTFLDQFCSRSLELVMRKNAPPGIYHAAYSDPIHTMEAALALHRAGLRSAPHGYDPREFVKNHVPRSAAVLDSSKFEKAYGTPFGDVRTALRWCINMLAKPQSVGFDGPLFSPQPSSEVTSPSFR